MLAGLTPGRPWSPGSPWPASVGGTCSTFGGPFVVDNYALLFKGLFLWPRLLVLLMSQRYKRRRAAYQGEF